VLGLIEEGLSEGGGGSPGTTPSNNLTDLDMRGGKGPGDIGYLTNSPGSVEAQAEAEAGLAESNAATNAAGGWDSPVG